MDVDLRDIVAELDFDLTKEQEGFLTHFIEGEGHYVLNGIAGSGKSTVMQVLKSYYKDEIVFFASTGVANLSLPNNIGSGTGHSGLSMPLKPCTKATLKKVNYGTSRLFASSDLVKIIVIDEAYGYNSDNLHVIWERIQRFNKKRGKRQKRNIRLLLVGDPCQQVTIADRPLKRELEARWGSHLMFDSEVWDRFNFTYACFNRAMRTEDKVFAKCLELIRYNKKDRFDKLLSWINQRVDYKYSKDQLILAATNKTVDKMNQIALDANPNPKIQYCGELIGDFELKDVIVKKDKVLAKDMRIMMTNNDQEGRWVNGSTGVIVSVSIGSLVVSLDQDNHEMVYTVEPLTLENKISYVEEDVKQVDGTVKDMLREEVVGSLTTLPIIPAASYSISKAQGVTLNSPFVLDFERSNLYFSKALEDFGTNFVYVGLSRATSIDLITLARPLHKEHIKPCLISIEYWMYCLERSIV